VFYIFSFALMQDIDGFQQVTETKHPSQILRGVFCKHMIIDFFVQLFTISNYRDTRFFLQFWDWKKRDFIGSFPI